MELTFKSDLEENLSILCFYIVAKHGSIFNLASGVKKDYRIWEELERTLGKLGVENERSHV